MTKTHDKTVEVIASFVTYLIDIGLIWFLACIFNPNIDSGLVWLIAMIYASVMGSLSVIRRAVKEK